MSDTISGREDGCIAELVSLAGVKGRSGLGREVKGIARLATNAYPEIVNSNLRRLSCILQNSGTSNIWLYLGNADNYSEFLLVPGGSFQIDKDFPWTGAIRAYAVGSESVTGAEILVP